VAERQLLSAITICRSHPEDGKAALVHGLDETGCDVRNSVLIGDLLPSSMFTNLPFWMQEFSPFLWLRFFHAKRLENA
jgi:hypothetical protein